MFLDFHFYDEKLLETVDQQASSVEVGTAAEEKSDEELFQQFMARNPVWDFHSLSKEQYMAKGKKEKLRLIRQYYYEMKNGERLDFYFCCLSSIGSHL